MQIVIDIPDEQIKKSLEESKYIHEDEGEKGFVNIALLYTNERLDFVDVERKTDFYSCKYKILPKGRGDLIDTDKLKPLEGFPCDDFLSREERLKMLMETGEFDFLKDIPSDKIWKLVFMLEFIGGTESDVYEEDNENVIDEREDENDSIYRNS